MITIIIIGVVWIVMGTETYRRLGGLEIERASVLKKAGSHHTSMCWYTLDKARACDCGVDNLGKTHLARKAVLGYTLWPGYLVGYAAINAAKTYKNLRGENYSFFVQPKMVKSKSERMQSIEEKTAVLHESLAGIDKEIKELQK